MSSVYAFAYYPLSFIELPTPKSTIWRYMSLSQFLAMLDTRTLHFSRADCLGDPLEGTITKPMVELRDFRTSRTLSDKEVRGFWRDQQFRNLKSVAISCWTMSKAESALMWSSYVKGHEGIAIKSTIGRLIAQFPKWRKRRSIPGKPADKEWMPIIIGDVRYLDYENETYPDAFNIIPLLHKHIVYKDERELRALLWITSQSLEEEGVSVPVDLSTLVDSIRVHPRSQPLLAEIVTKATRMHGFTFTVEQSQIVRRPMS